MTASRISTASEFVVTFASGGRSVRAGTYSEALDIARRAGATEIGHDGDLMGGGDRTLCWASEVDATDDDGARSLCSITAR